MDSDDLDRLSKEVIGAAIEVHRVLGPGLLESAYEESLAWELTNRGVKVDRQVAIPVRYKELRIEDGYRIDMLVNKELILELKSVDSFQPVHTAQMLTYLKMTGYKLGLLLNFKVDVMRKGIKRVVNHF
jgi:GxxExxY protein